ncbi:MAG: hypothetical protein M1823_004280 [Watsoniomyces obsoletus]|nr:MAG: hypothetical protein M1823_004280 [Watsoniomyces obsoletus]
MTRPHHLLIACTGSVATIKLPDIVQGFSSENVIIKIVMTENARKFLGHQKDDEEQISALDRLRQESHVEAIYFDEDEWRVPWTRGADILHIELRRWADLLLIAPLSANSLAKITMGMSDNLLLSVVRAWDTKGTTETTGYQKRILVAPAMNVAMWMHPITEKQIRVLEEEWGVNGSNDGWFEVLPPIKKMLACGDVGDGAMMEWTDIVKIVKDRLGIS